MRKTTVYLSDQLKRDIARIAREEGDRPGPRVPLWDEGFGAADAADQVDEVLAEGFGRDAAS